MFHSQQTAPTPPASLRARYGLATYLAVVFAALSALLTLILVLVLGKTASDEVRDTIGDSLAELASQTADKLDRGMFERYREVKLMAQRVDASEPDQVRRLLAVAQQSYPYYAWIGAAGMDGKVATATGGLLEGVDVSKRPWYANALAGTFVGDVHEAVLLAKLLPKTSNEPMRFVDVAFPYKGKNGKVVGVLGAHLSWQWARDIEQTILQTHSTRKQVHGLIVNSDGEVLLGPQGTLGLKAPTASTVHKGTGYSVEVWPDGRTYLVGHSPSRGRYDYPGLGWRVLVRQDTDAAFEPVKSMQRTILFSGLGIALAFSVFGVLAARRVSQPIQALSAAADSIASGKAPNMPTTQGSFAEVHALTRSLTALVTKLKENEVALSEMNQSLEKRVVKRTHELDAALADIRANEERIETILEAAQDAFIGVSLDGTITDWNARAAQMFGLSRAEVIGQPVAYMIVPPRLRDSFYKGLIGFNTTGEAPFTKGRIELTVCDKEGKEFPVETTITLAGGHQQAFFATFLHDISDRKQVEKMKNEFISTVSHELRTPITAIRISLGMLADGSVETFSPDVKKLIDIAYDSCERLVRMVNDILDIEKIESGRMQYQLKVQPLMPMVEAAVASTAAYAAPYIVGLTLDSDDSDPKVSFDHDRMTQVMVNLLSNAVKFSQAGQQVRVKVETRGDKARISVTDHGPGIPEEFQARIFQKFAQADGSNTRRVEGTGLGLSICQQLVQGHGGAISFETETGKGTTFHVDLPLA